MLYSSSPVVLPPTVVGSIPMVLGVVARCSAGGFRFDYILGEDGKPLFGEDNNTLIKEG